MALASSNSSFPPSAFQGAPARSFQTAQMLSTQGTVVAPFIFFPNQELYSKGGKREVVESGIGQIMLLRCVRIGIRNTKSHQYIQL